MRKIKILNEIIKYWEEDTLYHLNEVCTKPKSTLVMETKLNTLRSVQRWIKNPQKYLSRINNYKENEK